MEQDIRMDFNEREITIFYKPGIKKDTNTYTLARQVSSHIREIDVMKDKVTPTQLKEIVDMLGVDVEKLIERDSDTYREQFHDKDFDESGWIDVLAKNPDMMRTPIVFKGKKGIIIETPSNVLKLDESRGRNEVSN